MSIWNAGYQSVSCVYREKALDKVFLSAPLIIFISLDNQATYPLWSK